MYVCMYVCMVLGPVFVDVCTFCGVGVFVWGVCGGGGGGVRVWGWGCACVCVCVCVCGGGGGGEGVHVSSLSWVRPLCMHSLYNVMF